MSSQMKFTSKLLYAAKPASPRASYLAIQLDSASKQEILSMVTPKYKKIDCDHITVEFDTPTPELQEKYTNASLEVVGYQFGEGADCLVISVNGSIKRPDGGLFHVTLSLKGGHKANESNAVLKQQGYNIIIPFPIHGEIALLPK